MFVHQNQLIIPANGYIVAQWGKLLTYKEKIHFKSDSTKKAIK